MSGSSASWCKETDEKINYTKLCRLLVDGGTQAVRSVFDGIHPPSSLKATLNTYQATLQKLKKPKVLNNEQWDKLYPPSGSNPTSEEFDITLLFVLLRNICGLTPPVWEIDASGKRKLSWDKLPLKTDTSQEANLARIKHYRNNIIAHKSNTEINDADYEQHWQDISSALLSLGLSQDDIDYLKSAPLGEKDYNQLLDDWYLSYKDIKTQLEEVKSDMTDIKSDTALIPGIQEDISLLKNVYSSTHFQNLHINQLANSDFGSLIGFLSKAFHPNTRQWVLDEVKSHIYGDKSEPCGMLITAGAGMGKSTIAAKICQTYKDLGCLAGCHFFQFSNSTRNNPRLMLQSIARQMCVTVPGYREALESKLQTDLGKEITEMTCEELLTVLLEEPLHKLKVNKQFVVVLDAIDECTSDLKHELLHVLKSKLSLLPGWLRFVITSRPNVFKLEKYLDIDPENPQNRLDLKLFFTFELKQIHGDSDPDHNVVDLLFGISNGIFLVAFFLTDYLKKHKVESPKELLELFPNGISSVYENYFSRLKEEILPYISEEEGFYKMLEAVVASSVPLPKNMFYNILGLKSERDIPRTKKRARQDALNSLHSLFPVVYDHVTAFHKSVSDWLVLQEDEKHDFSVRVEAGNKALATQCYDVLSDIRNGRKDLNKPLVLTDEEKFSLTVCLDKVSKSVFENYFIFSSAVCFIAAEIKPFLLFPNRYWLRGFSDEVNEIFSLGVDLFRHQPKRDSQEMKRFTYHFLKHDESCPFAIPPNFGRCVEFAVNAVKNVFKQNAPSGALELLERFSLSNFQVKYIDVELEKQEGWPVSIKACGRGFLLVQETDQNTLVKKYLLEGTCLAKKSFPGVNKMLCMSTDHRYIVVTNPGEKGNIEIIDAKTLDLVTSYESPGKIRSCHAYGGQPWYIVIRCFDNVIYVMEGETGKLAKTYANKVNKYVEVKAVGNQGHVLLGRFDSCQCIDKDDADAFFTDKDGKLLEDDYGVPVPRDSVHLKYLLFHLERRDWNIPIYQPKKFDASCSCRLEHYGFSGLNRLINSMAFRFSDDGLLLAYSNGRSIFIINTSDGTLHKRVWLGPNFKLLSCDAILFVSQILLVIEDVTMIMFVDVQTNEIKHTFYPKNYMGMFYTVPKQEGQPFTLLTECFTDDQCVQQYVFHNLDF